MMHSVGDVMHCSAKKCKSYSLLSVWGVFFAPNSHQGAKKLALSEGTSERMSEYSEFNMMS